MTVALPPQQAKMLRDLVEARVDQAVSRSNGATLTAEDAARIVDAAIAEIPASPELIGGLVRDIARQLGLEGLLAKRGIDRKSLERSLGTAGATIGKVSDGGSVSDVVAKLGLPMSSSELVDRARTGDNPPTTEERTARIQTASARLVRALEDAGLKGALPVVDTAKLAESEIPTEMAEARDKSWSLYQQVKGSIAAGHFEVAEAQLELAAAHGLDYLYLASAYGDDSSKVEKMRAQNRLGMITHQFGALAAARGDEAGQKSCEVKALRWYDDVTSSENLDAYHPAAYMNALCSYGQLGEHDQGMKALQQLFDSCKDDAQREMMRGFLSDDAETMSLYGDRKDFRAALGLDH